MLFASVNMSDEQLISDPLVRQSRLRRRWLYGALTAAATGAALFSIALLNHNFRVLAQEGTLFEESLNRSLEAAIDYLDSRRMELTRYNPNAALTFMIRDMEELTGDVRLDALVEGYVNRFPNYYWLQMVYSESGKASRRLTSKRIRKPYRRSALVLSCARRYGHKVG